MLVCLSEAMEDHEVTSEEWSRRPHFSRFHFDRMVPLEETFVDALCEPAEVFTYGGLVAHVLTFATRRRTLVALALQKRGAERLGWGDPMLWSCGPAA